MAAVTKEGMGSMGTSREKIEDMRAALKKHPLYEKYAELLTDEYISVVMSQKKKGKVRTFEYSLNKLEKMLENVDTYDFRQVFKEIPKFMLEKPITYLAGVDKDGLPIMVSDLNRIDMKHLADTAKYQNALLLASVWAAVHATGTTRFRAVLLSQKVSIPLLKATSFFRLLHSFSKESQINIPDRSLRGYYFIPRRLSWVIDKLLPLLPTNLTRKLVIGEDSRVKRELQSVCDHAEDILPPELGGNSKSIERNVEFTVFPDGRLKSRIMDIDESKGGTKVIFKEAELPNVPRKHAARMRRNLLHRMPPNGK